MSVETWVFDSISGEAYASRQIADIVELRSSTPITCTARAARSPHLNYRADRSAYSSLRSRSCWLVILLIIYGIRSIWCATDNNWHVRGGCIAVAQPSLRLKQHQSIIYEFLDGWCGNVIRGI